MHHRTILGAVLATVLAAPSPETMAVDTERAFRQGLAAYESGDGLQAAEFWEPCAMVGDADCEYALGVLNDGGTSTWPGNTARAIQWLTRAARRGHIDAQVRLGFLYAIGRTDVAQNVEEAYIWFSMAAARGSTAARTHRARVMELMTELELERANRQLVQRGIQYRVVPSQPETEPSPGRAPQPK